MEPKTPESVDLMAAMIALLGPQGAQEKFTQLVEEQPAFALDVIRSAGAEVKSNLAIRTAAFECHVRLVQQAITPGADGLSDDALDHLEAALIEIREAEKDDPAFVRNFLEIDANTVKVDWICELLEAQRPSAVQRCLGRTRLTLFRGGRMRISDGSIALHRAQQDRHSLMRECLEVWFTLPAIAKSAIIFDYRDASLIVAFYKEPDPFDTFGNQYDWITLLQIRHDGTYHEFQEYRTQAEKQHASSPRSGAVPEASSRCFIATCVYGSADRAEIHLLRRYRDEVLLERLLGRVLIRWYEAISPPVVRALERTSFLKQPVRILLIRPLIAFARSRLSDRLR